MPARQVAPLPPAARDLFLLSALLVPPPLLLPKKGRAREINIGANRFEQPVGAAPSSWVKSFQNSPPRLIDREPLSLACCLLPPSSCLSHAAPLSALTNSRFEKEAHSTFGTIPNSHPHSQVQRYKGTPWYPSSASHLKLPSAGETGRAPLVPHRPSSGCGPFVSSGLLVPVPRGQSASISSISPAPVPVPVSRSSCLLALALSPILREQRRKGKGYHTCTPTPMPTPTPTQSPCMTLSSGPHGSPTVSHISSHP